jgi:hypothetical protein
MASVLSATAVAALFAFPSVIWPQESPPRSTLEEVDDSGVDPRTERDASAPESASTTDRIREAGAPSDLAASVLIARARSAHFTGRFSASVLCVRESYLGGRDTLRGLLESGWIPGERRLTLSGSGDAFEWWSRGDGLEQWRREGVPGQLRRLPPHSRKKPSFSPDVSYEDLARFPFGYLDGSKGARRFVESDTTTTFSLAPVGVLSTLYGDLAVTLSRRTALLNKIVFTGSGSRPSKSMVVRRYAATPAGSFPTEILFSSADGLSSTRFELTLLSDQPARDKVDAPLVKSPPRLPQLPRFAEPQWVPRDAEGR